MPWHQRANLSTQMAAEVIGVSRSTIFRLISEEVFRPLRVGRTVLVPVAQVSRYLRDLEQRAREAMPLSPRGEALLGRAMRDFGLAIPETRRRKPRGAADARRDRA